MEEKETTHTALVFRASAESPLCAVAFFPCASSLGRSGRETNEGDELRRGRGKQRGGRGLLPQTRRLPELSLFAIGFVFKFGGVRVPLLHKVARDGERDGCGYLQSLFATTRESGTTRCQAVNLCLKRRGGHVFLGTECESVTWSQEPPLIPDAVLRLEHGACAGSSVYSKQQNLGK